MLRRWLETPEVARWWPDADQQYAGLVEDLAGPDMTMLIVEQDGRPFGYVQHCDARAWEGAAFARDLPKGCRAMDAMIGEPDMLGRGHGARFLRQLALELHGRYGAVSIDPDPANRRAIRAYEKAGFRGEAIVDTPDGPARLMLFAA